MKELEKMNDTELKMLLEKIEKEQSNREEERKRMLERKNQYALKTPADSYTFLPSEFYNEVMKLGKTDPVLMEKLKEIKKKCSIKNRPKKEDIYPCPVCGEMMLRPGDFGSEVQIMCDNCDFVAPVKAWSYTVAWDEFHEWLMKEGYLP